MKVITGIFLILLQCILAFGAENYGNVRVDAVISIYDGDTFTCNILGWPAIIGNRISVRINGVDTPELKDKRKNIRSLALKAKVFAVEKIKAAHVIELRNLQRDKYFRILADVYLDGASLGDMLIESGLAKRYDGGTKPAW